MEVVLSYVVHKSRVGGGVYITIRLSISQSTVSLLFRISEGAQSIHRSYLVTGLLSH